MTRKWTLWKLLIDNQHFENNNTTDYDDFLINDDADYSIPFIGNVQSDLDNYTEILVYSKINFNYFLKRKKRVFKKKNMSFFFKFRNNSITLLNNYNLSFFFNNKINFYYFKFFLKRKKFFFSKNTSSLKKFKKYYSLSRKKINKFLFKFNEKQSSFFFQKKSLPLNIRIHQNFKILRSKLWNIYTKKKKTYKNRKKRLIYCNLYRNYPWKIHQARYVHWFYRTYSKLNEWRYNKLLGVELNYLINKKNCFSFLQVIFNSYLCLISWKNSINMLYYPWCLINGEFFKNNEVILKYSILELPIIIFKKKITQNLNNKNKHFFFKSRKFYYKTFKQNFKFKLIPKIFKKRPLNSKLINQFVFRDLATNSFFFYKKLNKIEENKQQNLTMSTVLTLQNWRYRFN